MNYLYKNATTPHAIRHTNVPFASYGSDVGYSDFAVPQTNYSNRYNYVHALRPDNSHLRSYTAGPPLTIPNPEYSNRSFGERALDVLRVGVGADPKVPSWILNPENEEAQRLIQQEASRAEVQHEQEKVAKTVPQKTVWIENKNAHPIRDPFVDAFMLPEYAPIIEAKDTQGKPPQFFSDEIANVKDQIAKKEQAIAYANQAQNLWFPSMRNMNTPELMALRTQLSELEDLYASAMAYQKRDLKEKMQREKADEVNARLKATGVDLTISPDSIYINPHDLETDVTTRSVLGLDNKPPEVEIYQRMYDPNYTPPPANTATETKPANTATETKPANTATETKPANTATETKPANTSNNKKETEPAKVAQVKPVTVRRLVYTNPNENYFTRL